MKRTYKCQNCGDIFEAEYNLTGNPLCQKCQSNSKLVYSKKADKCIQRKNRQHTREQFVVLMIFIIVSILAPLIKMGFHA